MKKHLTSIGNSFGIIIDKPILDLLDIDKNTPLEVKTDGRGLIIRPLYDEVVSDGGNGSVDAAEESAPPPPPGPASTASKTGAAPATDDPSLPPPPGAKKPRPPDSEEGETLAPPGPPPPSPPPTPEETMPPPPAAAAGSSETGVETPPGACIVITLRDDEVMRIPLTTDEFVVGREKGCDIHLDDRALSRRHAKLERRGASLWVEDLGSANGTYVNGEEIKSATRLDGGDVIGLGHYRVQIDGVEEAASDTPVLTLSGPEGVHRFALVGEEVVIGRAQTCDISIGHKSISRRHLKIQMDGGSFVAEDLGSQNGVKLFGKRIKGPTPFAPGELLEICDFAIELGFLKDEEVPEDETDVGKKEAKPRKSRTMLLDKSALVNAAYVDGDFDKARVGGKGHDGTGARAADTGEFDVGDSGSGKNAKGKVVRGKRR